MIRADDRDGTALDRDGFVVLPRVLDADQCAAFLACWASGDGLGEEVAQPRDTSGGGSYRMFARPLPASVATLQERLYPRVARILNVWAERLPDATAFPPSHAELLAARPPERRTGPTPVMSVRRAGDWNVMHRDPLHAFPLQVAILLSAPDRDFTGGVFTLNEQWPRMTGMAAVPASVPLGQGDAVLFPVHRRAAAGADGPCWIDVYHGMTRVGSGERHMMGVLF